MLVSEFWKNWIQNPSSMYNRDSFDCKWQGQQFRNTSD